MFGSPTGVHLLDEPHAQFLHPHAVAEVAALQHRVPRRPAERRVDGSGEAVGVNPVKCLVQAFDCRAGEPLGTDLQALRRHGLAFGAQVVGGVHHTVMAAPCAGDDGGVAGPGDGREVHHRATVQHRCALTKAPQVRQRCRVGGELPFELGLVQAVEQEHVQPARPTRRGEHLQQRFAVLAGEVHRRRRLSGRVHAVDQRKTEGGQTGGRDVDGTSRDVVAAHLHPRAAEPQRGARLADVEPAVRARLRTRTPVARRDGKVGRVGRVEQLRHTFVGERVGLMLGCDEPPRRVVRFETRGGSSGLFERYRAQRQRILSLDGVHAHHLEHLEVQAAIIVDQSLEPHHAALGPHLVAGGTPRENEVDLLTHLRVGQQTGDHPIAGLALLLVEALPLEPLGSVNAHGAHRIRYSDADINNAAAPPGSGRRGCGTPATPPWCCRGSP